MALKPKKNVRKLSLVSQKLLSQSLLTDLIYSRPAMGAGVGVLG
jgi:hypothetical protein